MSNTSTTIVVDENRFFRYGNTFYSVFQSESKYSSVWSKQCQTKGFILTTKLIIQGWKTNKCVTHSNLLSLIDSNQVSSIKRLHCRSKTGPRSRFCRFVGVLDKLGLIILLYFHFSSTPTLLIL